MHRIRALGTLGSAPTNTTASQPVAVAAPVAPPPAPPPARHFDPEAAKLAANEINEYLKSIDRQIEFNVDQETGSTVVKIMDSATGQVLRQIPSEAMLAIMHDLDKVRGLLIHAQV